MTSGVRITYNRLPEIAKKLPELAGAVVKKTAFDLKANVQEKAPVDTGYLKSLIKAEMTGNQSAKVGAYADYAYWVEYGTRKMAARPYMRPAADKARKAFVEAMKKIGEQL